MSSSKIEMQNEMLSVISAMFQRLRPIWNSPSLSLQIKMWLLATTVVCETWKMTKTIAQKLDVFHLRCLRRVLKITYGSMEVYHRAYTQPLSATVNERRFRCAGHILRLPDHWILKMPISWRPAQGKQKQGRPKITWKITFMKDRHSMGQGWSNCCDKNV